MTNKEGVFMQYKMIVSRLENGKIEQVNISIVSEPLAVMRMLAICYRDANKKTRKIDKITKATAWEAFTSEGIACPRFRFDFVYDELNHYIYEYHFTGIEL